MFAAEAKRLRENPPVDFDDRIMQRALMLARRGEGRVEPNPMVGCVVVKRGRIIGEGWHRRFGGPHAEINALGACAGSPRGATAYVTLEPCCHHGKTPPCTEALIEAGVVRVVVGRRDPNPLMKGGGVKQLRAAGIEVDVGILADQASELLAPYLTCIQLGRPYVIAKWAQSLDGKLATRTGHSKWISGEASRREVHRLRARVDAILVGSGTVRADDPLLTARGFPRRRQAIRVVLDGRLRIPVKCQMVDTAEEVPTVVMTSAAKRRTARARQLTARGVEVIAVPSRRGRLDLARVLEELGRREVTNLMVEGGPTILSAMFARQLVDEAYVFTAPVLIGGRRAPEVLGEPGVATVADAMAPRVLRVRRFGPDVLHRLRFTGAPR